MKEIKGFNNYFITKDGKVVNKKGQIRKTQISNLGYERVILKNKKTVKNISIHRLVALAFIPNPENKKCVNHIDSNRSNNNLSNLEWATHSENSLHSFSHNNRIQPFSKTVVNTVTGDVYTSIRIAAKLNGYKYPTLVAMLNNQNPNTSVLQKL